MEDYKVFMEVKRRTLAKNIVTPKVNNTGARLITARNVVKAPVSHEKHVDRIKTTKYASNLNWIRSL